MAVKNEIDGLAKIKVCGVGGGGCNAIDRMMKEQVPGVEFIAMNTDAQALMRSDAKTRLRLGDSLTRGLGVGGDPDLGRRAAEESRDEVYATVSGADMVFIAGGMGGGTGTGAAPVVAEIAKESGALTVAVVTKPFGFEGAKRSQSAESGITLLRENVDTLIVIPNDRLLSICDPKVSVQNAFMLADDILHQGILSIAELITTRGEINLDFADVKAIMGNAGPALMAIGAGTGENRAEAAARQAIANPLLDVSISGATGVLFNITGGSDMTLQEVHEAANVIRNSVDEGANIIFGVVTDPSLENQVKITIIATGFEYLPDTGTYTEIDRFLADALSEDDDMNVPPFLRRRAGIRHPAGRR